jgi:hypothetical protein
MGTVAVFKCCLMQQQPQRRRRIIDRSQIGLPTNFQHTGHIGSSDVNREASNLGAVQTQMQTKGGYSESNCGLSHFKLIDVQPAATVSTWSRWVCTLCQHSSIKTCFKSSLPLYSNSCFSNIQANRNAFYFEIRHF